MTRARTQTRVLAMLAAVALLLTAVAPVAAAPMSGDTDTTTTTPSTAVTDTVLQQQNATNTTAEQSQGPSLAAQSRLTAVGFNKDYLSVSRANKNTWNVSGPYAVFSSSEDISAARINQTAATAKVLDGSRTVRVSFSPDAAPEGEQSLYRLELFFGDGSSRTVRLFASDTEQIVASAELANAQDFIETMKEDAAAHGYPETIDGIEQYHDWEKQQADLLSDLFGPQLKKLFAWLILTIQTPFAVIGLALAAILGLLYARRVHGWKIRDYVNGDTEADKQYRDILRAYYEEQTAAAEERLNDIDMIGPDHIFWRDAFDVESTRQLARLFAIGEPARDSNGNILRDTDADPLRDENGDLIRDGDGNPVHPPVMRHRGIWDLDESSDYRDTWLEPILRPDMLGDPETALAHATRVLTRMTETYGQQRYRDARKRTRRLQEGMEDRRETDAASTRTLRSTDSGTWRPGQSGAAGGDD
jgi:hypothetical protein